MRKWSLASRLLIGQLAFILCLSAGLSWALYVQAEQHSYEETADRMLSVAETIAADPFVLESVTGENPSAALQPYAAEVMGSAHVDFLTIMAPDRTRFTHRNESEIGRQYIGSVDQSLDVTSFTEVYTGTLGPSVRAMVPVLERLRDRAADLPIIGAPEHAGQAPAVVLPRVAEELSPLVEIIPVQRLAHAMAIARHHDPDAPRGLSKVTRTT